MHNTYVTYDEETKKKKKRKKGRKRNPIKSNSEYLEYLDLRLFPTGGLGMISEKVLMTLLALLVYTRSKSLLLDMDIYNKKTVKR